jgi:hypothetical protein
MHRAQLGARPERAGPDRVNAAVVRLLVADALARSRDTQQIPVTLHIRTCRICRVARHSIRLGCT